MMKHQATDESVITDVRWLLGAIARNLHARSDDATALMLLERMAEQNISPEAFQDVLPQTMTNHSYLAETIAETMLLEPDLAAALAAVDGHLRWLQLSSSSSSVICEIIGENGFFHGQSFTLGLIMLGPETTLAVNPGPWQAFIALSSHASCQIGAATPSQWQAGQLIDINPEQGWQLNTADQPFLALWFKRQT